MDVVIETVNKNIPEEKFENENQKIEEVNENISPQETIASTFYLFAGIQFYL